ncbi:HIRAN domain-containing protein [Flammeovirga sp. OC4]|uniref:HIRAN domain-containing protein n=1 Tax=Flammeovirga sp. OC4 TaxID=1382345 RepID=UPI0005C65A48|nr:HIRAN domain-containing protein [Flammeovirga sp. OC4]
MSLTNWSIIIAVIIIFIFFLRLKNKSKKQALKKQEEEAKKKYQLYLKRFNDVSNLKKLEPQITKVAGTKYDNEDTGVNRQEIIKKTKEGELLMLLPDELNRFDSSAIKVVRLNDEQIGFLDMDISVEVKSRLKSQSLVEAKILKIYKEKDNFEVEIALQRYSRKLKQPL